MVVYSVKEKQIKKTSPAGHKQCVLKIRKTYYFLRDNDIYLRVNYIRNSQCRKYKKCLGIYMKISFIPTKYNNYFN